MIPSTFGVKPDRRGWISLIFCAALSEKSEWGLGVNLFLTEAVWAPQYCNTVTSNRLPAYSFYGFFCFVLYLINYHAFKIWELGVLTSCKLSETLLTTDVLTQETEKTLNATKNLNIHNHIHSESQNSPTSWSCFAWIGLDEWSPLENVFLDTTEWWFYFISNLFWVALLNL